MTPEQYAQAAEASSNDGVYQNVGQGPGVYAGGEGPRGSAR
ncbi:hypothetical protein ACIHFD_44840 [Nonomuraea sp. NPDC051941]